MNVWTAALTIQVTSHTSFNWEGQEYLSIRETTGGVTFETTWQSEGLVNNNHRRQICIPLPEWNAAKALYTQWLKEQPQ
jgi:hypothetical protein